MLYHALRERPKLTARAFSRLRRYAYANPAAVSLTSVPISRASPLPGHRTGPGGAFGTLYFLSPGKKMKKRLPQMVLDSAFCRMVLVSSSKQPGWLICHSSAVQKVSPPPLG